MTYPRLDIVILDSEILNLMNELQLPFSYFTLYLTTIFTKSSFGCIISHYFWPFFSPLYVLAYAKLYYIQQRNICWGSSGRRRFRRNVKIELNSFYGISNRISAAAVFVWVLLQKWHKNIMQIWRVLFKNVPPKMHVFHQLIADEKIKVYFCKVVKEIIFFDILIINHI